MGRHGNATRNAALKKLKTPHAKTEQVCFVVPRVPRDPIVCTSEGAGLDGSLRNNVWSRFHFPPIIDAEV